jgi:hypothetical protein
VNLTGVAHTTDQGCAVDTNSRPGYLKRLSQNHLVAF